MTDDTYRHIPRRNRFFTCGRHGWDCLGVPCPECKRLLPRASPTILLPGYSCNKRGHKYKDPRVHDPKANQFIEDMKKRRSKRGYALHSSFGTPKSADAYARM